MYESNEEITERVEALFTAAERLCRGQILTRERISEILGVSPYEGRWQHCIEKLKRRMEKERGISLWPEHTVGYKLCTAQEQLELPHEYTKRARRRIKRGLQSVKSIPIRGLTAHQQTLRAAQIASLQRSHRDLSAQLNQTSLCMRPSETLPRRTPSPA